MRAFAAAAVLLAASNAHAAPTTSQCIEANEQSIALRHKLELLEARRELETCASPSCPAEITEECARRLRETVAAIPSVVFAAKDETGADLTNVVVTMDGHPFAPSLGVRALEIDPGTHAFVFESPGKPTVTRTLVVREGEKDRREVVTFALPAPAASSSKLRTAGFVVGGIGLAGIIVGSVFGGLTFAQNGTADQHCPNDACDPIGVQAGKDAETSATISTIAFAAGLGLVAAGVVMFAVGGPKRTTARLELAPGALFLRGSF